MSTAKNIPRSALIFDAPVTLAALDAARVRRFDGIAYSGQAITGHWYWDRVIFDLSTTTAPDRLPMLVGHDRSRIAGFSESVEIGPDIKIRGRLSSATEHGREVAKLADEGFPWQMSVHIKPGIVEELPAGESVVVNGHTFAGPGSIFRHSRLSEVSFTPTGADPNTAATVMADGDGDSVTFQSATKDTDMPDPNQPAAPATPPAPAAPENDFADRLNREKARADALEAKLNAVQAELMANRTARRAEQVKGLFADLGRTFTDESAKPYMELPEATFDAVAADMRRMRPSPPEGLFADQATGGADTDQATIDAMANLTC